MAGVGEPVVDDGLSLLLKLELDEDDVGTKLIVGAEVEIVDGGELLGD